jgi:PKD repeat protein
MKLFISYSRDDKNIVYELASKLNADAQHDVWIDRRLTGADLWWDTILNSIEACDCFVFIVTPRSVASIYCMAELNYALALEKPVLPLMLKSAEMPAPLRKVQYIDIGTLSLIEALLQCVQALHRVEMSIIRDGGWNIPIAAPTRPPVPQAQAGVPDHIYEAFAAAEEAYANGNVTLAEDLYKNVISADPDSLGKVAMQRMGQLRRRADMVKAYASIERMVNNQHTEAAQLVWQNYLRDYGLDYDPLDYRALFGTPAEIAPTGPSPILGLPTAPPGSAVNAPMALVAAFDAQPTQGPAPLRVAFINRTTGEAMQYLWDFNGDGITDSLEPNPTHTYYNSGTYNARLSVIGKDGYTSVVQSTITVIPASTNAVSPHIPPAQPVSVSTPTEQPYGSVPVDYLNGRMRFIAAGEFIFGQSERVFLSEYFMDIYPVTNQDFYEFVRATKAKPPSAWVRGSFPAELALHPVTGVTYEDATAYCQWLGKRLPTAQEWEKAARGVDGRFYPWGNSFEPNRCNGGRKTTTTSAVTDFPSSISPYGIYDMVGNVWEWTSSQVKSRGVGRGQNQVIKGGSFRSDIASFKCSASSDSAAHLSRDDLGFRAVWSQT